MTTEQKIMMLLVLVLSGGGAAYYVNNSKSESDSTSYSVKVAPETNSNISGTGINNIENKTSIPVGTNPSPTISTTGTAPAKTTTTETPASTYKTVSSTVEFSVPKGFSDTMQVTIMVKNGMIADITFNQGSSNRESAEYAQRFNSSFNKSAVVGKMASEVSLSRIGGASLTTRAFNSALADAASKI